MISKERLEELIKQGVTTYSVDLGDRIVTEHNKQGFFYLNFLAGSYSLDNYSINCNNWFETKGQAQWYLDHTFERTERLELPMWEEFKNYNENISISFVGEDWYVYELSNDYDLTTESKCILLQQNGKDWMEWDFNEENYEKACDLCLKLFKGENND